VFGPKVKLTKELYEKAKEKAELAGYSSVDEFVAHVLEKEISGSGSHGDDEGVKERLKGLGYIS
jgi:hypothetical protein